MNLMIYAVRDSAQSAYARPIFVPSSGLAIRSFSDEVNRKDANNTMNNHPSDFELWLLGSFDELTGTFINETPRCVCRAIDVIIKE